MTAKMSPGDTALQANDLCNQCGICCLGRLFSHVSVSRGEVKTVEKAGLTVYERGDGKLAFRQPCPRFIDDKCSIYMSRPAKCSAYFCTLQKGVLNGSIPFEKGQNIVAGFKQQAGWLSEKAAILNKSEASEVNLRNFLFSYHDDLKAIRKKRAFTEAEIIFIRNAFEHSKMIDRFFNGTRLLTKYALLVQSLKPTA